MRKYWTEKEEKLLEEAWNSTAYDRYDLERIFQRSWNSISSKAEKMGFPQRYVIEEMARVEAIEKALKEDLVI